MKTIIWALIIPLLAQASSLADRKEPKPIQKIEIKGDVYENVTLTDVQTDEISISHDAGVATIPLANLTRQQIEALNTTTSSKRIDPDWAAKKKSGNAQDQLSALNTTSNSFRADPERKTNVHEVRIPHGNDPYDTVWRIDSSNPVRIGCYVLYDRAYYEKQNAVTTQAKPLFNSNPPTKLYQINDQMLQKGELCISLITDQRNIPEYKSLLRAFQQFYKDNAKTLEVDANEGADLSAQFHNPTTIMPGDKVPSVEIQYGRLILRAKGFIISDGPVSSDGYWPLKIEDINAVSTLLNNVSQ